MKIYIFGLGSLGSNLLVLLSKMLRDIELIGIDFDIVEERNIGIQAYFLEHIGIQKTQAMLPLIHRYNRNVKYLGINKKIKSIQDLVDLKIEKNDLIIDCFDTAKYRKFFLELNHHKLVHIGFSPHYTAELIWHERYTISGEVEPDAQDICSLRDATAFIGFVVNFAAMNINEFISTGNMKNYIITQKYIIKKL